MYARAQCINCIVQYSAAVKSSFNILALNVKPKHCLLAYLLPDPCGTLSVPSSSIEAANSKVSTALKQGSTWHQRAII